jgi:hypothetical protein
MKRALFQRMIDQLNAENGWNISLDPQYTPEKVSQNNAGVGYIICRLGDAPARKLILILDEGGYCFDDAKAQIHAEVMDFWYGSNSERLSARTIVS